MGWFESNSKDTPEVKKREPIKPGRNANIPQLEFVSDITNQPSIFPFEETRVWFVSNDGGIGRSNMGNDKEIEIPPEYAHGPLGVSFYEGSNYIDRNYLYFIEEEEGFIVRIHKPPDPNDLFPILEKLTETEIISLCLHDDKYCGPVGRITSVKGWISGWWKEGLAKEREKALDYDSAIEIWKELGEIEEETRVRKLKADQGAVKVDQTVVHGDYVDDRDTIVKDSVISRSNVGPGVKSKAEQIKEIKELLDSGAISDEDYEKMKREIIG